MKFIIGIGGWVSFYPYAKETAQIFNVTHVRVALILEWPTVGRPLWLIDY